MAYLLIGNDMRVYFKDPLKDQDGNAITSGTVEATLYNASVSNGALSKGSAVSGGALTLSHEGSGVWSAILDSTVSLTVGSNYIMTVTADDGSTEAQWDIRCIAAWRE